MDVAFFSTLERIRYQVNETAANVLEHVTDETTKAQYLDDLKEVLVTCVTCEHKVAIMRQSVQEATARATDGKTGQPCVDLFDELLEETIGELQADSTLEEALRNSPILKAFNQMVEESTAGNQDDLIAKECTPSLIDPISKRRMTDPVKNKHCGHVYDRESITAMIAAKHKNGIKCPEIGCSNRVAIKLSDLEDAPEVRRYLAKQQEQDSDGL